jgi:DNA-binding transcriptional MerR regulator/methylmalonyl-CoA mutase cobalamin-binding subunit
MMRHSINIAAKRSGLTPHVIRVWEKRYNAVTPVRTDTNRRQYSDEDIKRLALLREATLGGHKISNIASLPKETLESLTEEDRQHIRVEESAPLNESLESDSHLDACITAIKALNQNKLEEELTRSALNLGHQGMIIRVVAPLAQQLGLLWREGHITAAHEHFASALIRTFLANISKPFAITDSAPGIVIATPFGQLHELGAVLASAAASSLGWRVTYLGTNLPAAEIAGAVVQNKASVLGLSIVFPENDPHLGDELSRLRSFLPADVKVVVGGRASFAYHGALTDIGAHVCKDINEYYGVLEKLS